MKLTLLVAAAVVALSSAPLALAQNSLPTTTVTAPKPPVHPVITTRAPAPAAPLSNPVTRGQMNTMPPVPLYPDPNFNVRAKDWNAPGGINLHYMTDEQFAQFEMLHPTAVIINRCYIGQDPDLQVRSQLRKAYGGVKGICG
jgi:hypothetical protein